MPKEALVRAFDPEFKFLIKRNEGIKLWAELMKKYWAANFAQETWRTKHYKASNALARFAIHYLEDQDLLSLPPIAFFSSDRKSPSLFSALSLRGLSNGAVIHDAIVDFLEWVLKNELSNVSVDVDLAMPFHRMRPKRGGFVENGFEVVTIKNPDLEPWRVLIQAYWIAEGISQLARTRALGVATALTRFATVYIDGQNLSNLSPKQFFEVGSPLISLYDGMKLGRLNKKNAEIRHDRIVDFLNWVLHERLSRRDRDGYRVVPDQLAPPFKRLREPNVTFKDFDTEFTFLVRYHKGLAPWGRLMAQYCAPYYSSGSRSAWVDKVAYSLSRFAVLYLNDLRFAHLELLDFFDARRKLPSLYTGMKLQGLSKNTAKHYHDIVCDFLLWVLREKLQKENIQAKQRTSNTLQVPFERMKAKRLDKASDPEFKWLLTLDPDFEEWRRVAAEWLEGQTSNYSGKHHAIQKFLEIYIYEEELEKTYNKFLLRKTYKPDVGDVFAQSKNAHAKKLTINDVTTLNYIADWIDWILKTKLSKKETGGWDRDLYHNPVRRLSKQGYGAPTESTKPLLSISYIKELRSILAEGAHFKDWHWAQGAVPSTLERGDWFVVDAAIVNRDDPDCVWRERQTTTHEQRITGYDEIVTEIWSPVRAMALYIKLELPLRMIQVRMLDSGEADTFRYEYNPETIGRFDVNTNALATGSIKRPYQRGVFHWSPREANGASLYINTNKSADVDKAENEKGYVIPWAHEQVLYWMSKLRDWQERYNPLDKPTLWSDLQPKHFGGSRPHESVLNQRGTACFLFRSPLPERSDFPITANAVQYLWYQLLKRLEDRCAKRGETLDDGRPLTFVEPGNNPVALFTLHSLRVSLISYLVLDLDIPVAIVSKLVAGHASIIMTLYYTKFGRSTMKEVFDTAEREQIEADQKNHRRFLSDATYETIEARFASLSNDAFYAAASSPAAGLVFEDRGICPVGGSKCDVGGERIDRVSGRPVFAPVPGYPQERNCVRCRFFLTGAAFIGGLMAHFNAVSERIHRASKHLKQLTCQQRELEAVRYQCEREEKPFLHTLQLERLSQRIQEAYESSAKHVNDLRATNYLLQASIAKAKHDKNTGETSLVSTGSVRDLELAFIESDSELHQLEVVCQNAVVYPNQDATPAILRRSQILDFMLTYNSSSPLLAHLTPEDQLLAGNALMKVIEARTGSLRNSLPYAECKQQLSELGLMANHLEEEVSGAIQGSNVQDLIAQAKAKRSQIAKKKEPEDES